MVCSKESQFEALLSIQPRYEVLLMYIVCILNENVFDYMNIGNDCPHDPPVPTAMTQ